MVCTFQKSCHLLKLSKMLMGNIYNWLLQGNGAITRMLESGRELISRLGKFFKPLDNIRRFVLQLLPDGFSLIY